MRLDDNQSLEVGCSVARAMRALGERWSILIIREAFYGITHFDDFERKLGVATNVLSARLKTLVEFGLMERKVGLAGKRRTYHLTEKGKAFFPVYVALKSWADAWQPGGGDPAMRLCDAKTGEEIQVAPLVRSDGSKIVSDDLVIQPRRQLQNVPGARKSGF
ncbi:hypothetical protein AWV79_13790 [Cupriavidus sp. UYMMa02A]|nr:hypothetical protein AWV79_13790 [Cupriavidus sp. UYMMa02A]